MAVVNSVLTGAAALAGVIAAPRPPDPSDNSMPGLGAFIVFAFLAVALYFILKNMNSMMRRMSYRERERQAAEEQQAAAEIDLRDAHTEPVVSDTPTGDERGPDHPEPAPGADGGESGESHTP